MSEYVNRDDLYKLLDMLLQIDSKFFLDAPLVIRGVYEVIRSHIGMVMSIVILKKLGIIYPDEILLQSVVFLAGKNDYSGYDGLMCWEIGLDDEAAPSCMNMNSTYYDYVLKYDDFMDNGERHYARFLGRIGGFFANNENMKRMFSEFREKTGIRIYCMEQITDLIQFIDAGCNEKIKKELLLRSHLSWEVRENKELRRYLDKCFPEYDSSEIDLSYYIDNDLIGINEIYIVEITKQDISGVLYGKLKQYWSNVYQFLKSAEGYVIEGAVMVEEKGRLMIIVSPFYEREGIGNSYDLADMSPLFLPYIVAFKMLLDLEMDTGT